MTAIGIDHYSHAAGEPDPLLRVADVKKGLRAWLPGGPRGRTLLLAAVFAALAVLHVFDAKSYDAPLGFVIAAVLPLLAGGLLFRLPFARLGAVIPLTLIAATSFVAGLLNALPMAAAPIPTLAQIAGFCLPVVTGAVAWRAAGWLESAQAKAHFSRRNSTQHHVPRDTEK